MPAASTPAIAGETAQSRLRLKKVFLRTLVLSLTACALVAVVALLIGTFNETTARILSTLGALAVHSGMAMACAHALERQRWPKLSTTGLILFGFNFCVIEEAVQGQAVSEDLRKQLAERYRPGVEQSLKREVLLDAVARQEKLEVSDEEVAGEIQRMAQSDPRQAARVRARYQSAERREALRDSLLEHRALDWLIDAAEIEDVAAAASPLIMPAGR